MKRLFWAVLALILCLLPAALAAPRATVFPFMIRPFPCRGP